MERGLASGPCTATMAMVTLANAPPPVPVGMVTQAEVQGALVASPVGTPGVDSVNHYRLRMTRGYAPRVPPRVPPSCPSRASHVSLASTTASCLAHSCCKTSCPPWLAPGIRTCFKQNTSTYIPPAFSTATFVVFCHSLGLTGSNAPRALHAGQAVEHSDEEWILEVLLLSCFASALLLLRYCGCCHGWLCWMDQWCR